MHWRNAFTKSSHPRISINISIYSEYGRLSVVCVATVSCAVTMGNVSWMLFQEGQSSNLWLRRGVGQAVHTRKNPSSIILEFIVHKQWIMLLQLNCIEFYSRDSGSLHYHTHWSSSFIQSCLSPFEIFCRLQLQHKAATLALVTPHIARAINI